LQVQSLLHLGHHRLHSLSIHFLPMYYVHWWWGVLS